MAMRKSHTPPHEMVSLFAGIGGFELAFSRYGVRTILMCEIDPVAKQVLHSNLPDVAIIDDVKDIKRLPKETDLLCAGFPCQDLSSVGEKQGLSGSRSSLVKEVFRILRRKRVEWVIFENVSFMLSLNGGETISTIVTELEELGYNWAYRVIDSIAFVPQHRKRVYIVASIHNDPCSVLLSDSYIRSKNSINDTTFSHPLGFYWTEGRNALGLICDGIPTLKAGSTIGIPSPPAIAFPNGEVSCPDIRDAERLQGFPADWTKPAEEISKPSYRWRLVGNAVTVDTVMWIARKMVHPVPYDGSNDPQFEDKKIWPKAAWGKSGKRYVSSSSPYPEEGHDVSLIDFLEYPRKPLSLKASIGFEKRLREGGMNCPSYFLDTIQQYIHNKQE